MHIKGLIAVSDNHLCFSNRRDVLSSQVSRAKEQNCPTLLEKHDIYLFFMS